MGIIQHCYAFGFLGTYQPLSFRRFKGTVTCQYMYNQAALYPKSCPEAKKTTLCAKNWHEISLPVQSDDVGLSAGNGCTLGSGPITPKSGYKPTIIPFRVVKPPQSLGIRRMQHWGEIAIWLR